jgi:hypothetical protein
MIAAVVIAIVTLYVIPSVYDYKKGSSSSFTLAFSDDMSNANEPNRSLVPTRQMTNDRQRQHVHVGGIFG